MAFGVPPQMLGIPGDNTYSNLQEARLALWEQTVLPLVHDTLCHMSRWLEGFFGNGLELKADVSKVTALATRNQAMWNMVNTATFLTDNEKRAAVGYGPLPDGDELPPLTPAMKGFKYNPDQPRVPAGSSDGGQWTSDGGGESFVAGDEPPANDPTTDRQDYYDAINENPTSGEYLANREQETGGQSDLGNGTQVADASGNTVPDSQQDDKLATEQVGNIIFNETRSLSSTPTADINDARENIAFMVRNGEAWADERGGDRPITADDFLSGAVPQVEQQTYSNCQTAAANADAAISQGKTDPTNGAIYMSIVGDNQTILNGKTLTLSTGPFHNSFPYGDVPYSKAYINFSK